MAVNPYISIDDDKIVTVHGDNGNGKPELMQVTLRELRDLSVKQRRLRLNGEQIEALLELNGARWLIGNASAKLVNTRVRHTPGWRLIRTAAGMLRRWSEDFMGHTLDLEQVLVVDRALTGMGIHITHPGDAKPDHCLCMDTDAVAYIANTALWQCALECQYGTTKQAKKCKLRYCLNQIPGFQEQCANGRELLPDVPGICPYYLVLHPEVAMPGELMDDGGE